MSIAMYLTIPGVNGSSTDPGWVGSLDVLAYSWGVSNAGTAIGSPGKANFQDLSVTCYLDTATAPLSQHAFSGASFKQAVLSVIYPAPGPSGTATDVYTLLSVLVSSVSLGGSGGEDKLTVNYSFNYAALSFQLHGRRASWDLRTNSPGVAD